MQVKKCVPIPFQSLEANIKDPAFMMCMSPDEDKQWGSSFTQETMHLGFLALSKFEAENGRLPAPWCPKDAAAVVQIAKEINGDGGSLQLDSALETRPIELLALTSSGTLVPLAGVLGGYVAQEALKAVMDKYTPLQQTVYVSYDEVVPVDLTQVWRQ